MGKSGAEIEFPTSIVRGFILVGGHSSRFGQDKAQFEIAGRPMALRVADVLGRVVDSISLVGAPEKYRHLGLPVVPDAYSDIGPVGGIIAALESSDTHWNLILACDLPFLDEHVLKNIAAEALHADAGVVWPRTPDGHLQPLCGAYTTKVSVVARQAVEDGFHKVTDVFASCGPAELAVQDNQSFGNINSLNDLESLPKVPRNET